MVTIREADVKRAVDVPLLGEIKRSKDIGYRDISYGKHIWAACRACGKERWVRYIGGRVESPLCPRCARLGHRHSWKGGRIKHGKYIKVWVCRDDFFFPMVSYQWKHGGYILEHRLVMAKHLGRRLHSWEVVHHKRGVAKDDNRIEGLQLVTDDRHRQITILEGRIKYLEGKNAQLQAENKRVRNQESHR